MTYGFVQQMRSWWQHDRIRISPQEGRLLRVEAGDIVSFQGRDYVVSARSVDEQADHTLVRLTCDSDAKSAAMELQISDRGELVSLWWVNSESHRRCDPWELEVWPRQRMV